MTLLSEASFLVTPNGYKEDKLYAAIPTNGDGDMTVTRATTATRVDENDLVSSVASNVPRIDYTGGGCPSILLEPQRTNIVLRSQEFDNASFVKNLSSVSANTTTAPDGTLTADTWTGDGVSGVHYLAQIASATSGVAYTQSVFAKKGTNDFIQIVGPGAIYTTGTVFANFDLENGFLGTIGASATATITDFGNGWYRCTMTATATATVSSNGFQLGLITSATSARRESNSLETSVHLWGAQVEAGAYPTSYIPTTTATVTRNADVISKTGISSLIGQTEGTVFMDINWEEKSGVYYINSISNGSTNNEIYMSFGNSFNNSIRFSISSGGSYSVTFNSSVLTSGRYKIAFAYANNDATAYINGTQVFTDNTVSVPSTSEMKFLRANNTSGYSGTINASALWKTRLTNAELISLTTL
jgi:hypothetical protein